MGIKRKRVDFTFDESSLHTAKEPQGYTPRESAHITDVLLIDGRSVRIPPVPRFEEQPMSDTVMISDQRAFLIATMLRDQAKVLDERAESEHSAFALETVKRAASCRNMADDLEAAALAPASSERAAAGDTYAYAEDSEGWSWEGGFASREEAEQEGREEYPDGFSTGRCRPATLKDVYPGGMAETLIDRIGAEDESGTPMEDYAEKVHELVIRPALGGKDTRLLVSLEMALMTAFETWAAEHLPRPDWFYMEDVQPAPAPAVAE